MIVPGLLVTICWLVLFVYWIASSFNTKRYARRNASTWGIRLIFILAILISLHIPIVDAALGGANILFPPWVQWLGVVLNALGVALAIWARVYLGRNWGMPMSLKQDAELVTTGPYAYVRHPIYSGFLLASFGATLVTFWWIIGFVLLGAYFIWSALTEEKIMLGEFPAQYAAYKAHTWRLIPYVW